MRKETAFQQKTNLCKVKRQPKGAEYYRRTMAHSKFLCVAASGCSEVAHRNTSCYKYQFNVTLSSLCPYNQPQKRVNSTSYLDDCSKYFLPWTPRIQFSPSKSRADKNGLWATWNWLPTFCSLICFYIFQMAEKKIPKEQDSLVTCKNDRKFKFL